MKTNNIVLGILANVDSGKTTLAESLLYLSGSIRKFGRVDHKDAFFDNYEMERARGITIFSKQGQIKYRGMNICLLDTPGHVDFSAEMERTLQVLDYAILVISAPEGIQGHTMTLWQLLDRYKIPTFIFINKMDISVTDRIEFLSEMQKKLCGFCIDFCEADKDKDSFWDKLAMCSEKLLDSFLENGEISRAEIALTIIKRKIFPCFFGSALKQEGVKEFLNAICTYMELKNYPDEFSARVFKIASDDKKNRLTYMKVTGGSLKVKDILANGEKADQIRIYSGNQFNMVKEAEAGAICAVAGLTKTFAGEGIGALDGNNVPMLESVLSYRVEVLDNCNIHDFYLKLRSLSEEYPELNVEWSEKTGKLQIQAMGTMQLEILKNIINERFGVSVEFGARNIIYKETIAEAVIGIGHFEPLKHYAEVHLLIEPLERGSGLEFAVRCSEDLLDKNWQRLIMSHLEEKKHIGVLTGSDITDIRITLIAGKAHLKHTEDGDFRQAAYRAVRHGLKSAQSVLLEPVYKFRIEVPKDCVGRAMSDIQRRNGNINETVVENDMAVMTGYAPAALLSEYQLEVASYSRGFGRFSCSMCVYDVCHNVDEVIQNIGYDSESDIDNPTGSIFCSHGTGYYVEWEKVREYAHVDNGLIKKNDHNDCISQNNKKKVSDFGDMFIAQDEIDAIFERTFGNAKKKRNKWGRKIVLPKDEYYKGRENVNKYEDETEYLLVDGYNIIFSWEELRALSERNIDSARDKLMDILCNYQGYKKMELILVFDAYKVCDGKSKMFDYHNIHVVYTKESETADQYIEKITHEIGRKHKVVVATSDRIEQMIVWGQGAKRLSAQELLEEIEAINNEISSRVKDGVKKRYLFDNVDDDLGEIIDNIRRNKTRLS